MYTTPPSTDVAVLPAAERLLAPSETFRRRGVLALTAIVRKLQKENLWWHTFELSAPLQACWL